MARIREASCSEVTRLDSFECAELPSELSSAPPTARDQLPAGLSWIPAGVPGTLASALHAQKRFGFDSRRDLDDSEVWYRTRFTAAAVGANEAAYLRFGGLATLANVWLNGTMVLDSSNMFVEHQLDVSGLLREHNELYVRFRALNVELKVRRPRPRHRTRLIERQQLRWIRTTLLGRMPGWTPPVAPVGPWREITLERRRNVSLLSASVRPSLQQGEASVAVEVELRLLDAKLLSAHLRVGSTEGALRISEGDVSSIAGRVVLPDAERWWPNGYGDQPRYEVELRLETDRGSERVQLDPVAFRSIEASQANDGFALVVNGVEIRCRGACWSPSDFFKLQDDDATRRALGLAQAAGMNMLRVGGTMAYESDAFYDECDRLGLLVWQDFMFANCDYPADDAEFMRSVQQEVQQLLSRLEPRACVAVLCGSSEVEQQIAMLGLPRAQWKPPLFETTLRELAKQGRPEAPYLPSTPTGGALPFQVNSGVTHYYGVGAYLRPLEDARRANVKFAAECLAFSNVPETALIEQLLDGKSPFHHPRWKERVPRDNGAGWDFEDVRDHYVKLLFGFDPLQLRYEDPERALELGRVATGEVMARTLSEWRRRDSTCRGALIWLMRDLWPGAGWGLLDSNGNPKAAYYFVKRAMQPRALFVSDEGTNGLTIHAFNDTAQAWQAELELGLWRAGSVLVEAGKTRISVPPHSAIEVAGAELFDHFLDLSHAFRFGPPSYDVAVARAMSESGELVSQASHYLCPFDTDRDLGLKGRIEQTPTGPRAVLTATRFTRAVALDLPGFLPSDSYFDLLAGETRTVEILPLSPASAAAAEVPKGTVRSLAQRSPIRLQ